MSTYLAKLDAGRLADVPRRLAVVYRRFIGGRQAIAENFQGSGRVERIADSVYTICFDGYEMQHSSQQCVPIQAAHIDIQLRRLPSTSWRHCPGDVAKT